jgi:hypothetical protein
VAFFRGLVGRFTALLGCSRRARDPVDIKRTIVNTHQLDPEFLLGVLASLEPAPITSPPRDIGSPGFRLLKVTITKGTGGFGMRVSPAAIVMGYTEPGSPAELAGLPVEGRIDEVNGVAVEPWGNIVKRERKKGNRGTEVNGVAWPRFFVAQLKASADPNTFVFTVIPAPPAEEPAAAREAWRAAWRVAEVGGMARGTWVT